MVKLLYRSGIKQAAEDLAKAAWDWQNANEAFVSDALPALGSVLGAGVGATYGRALTGSAIGAGLGGLTGMALPHKEKNVFDRLREALKTAALSPKFIEGAVEEAMPALGSVIGGTVAGGVTDDRDQLARNLVAGTALGYTGGAGAHLLLHKLLQLHK